MKIGRPRFVATKKLGNPEIFGSKLRYQVWVFSHRYINFGPQSSGLPSFVASNLVVQFSSKNSGQKIYWLVNFAQNRMDSYQKLHFCAGVFLAPTYLNITVYCTLRVSLRF